MTTPTITHTTLSERRFYVTLTGVRGGEFGGDFGPAIATVTISQRDGEPAALPGGAFTPSYYVAIDGRHAFGGVAAHLRQDGTPADERLTFHLGGRTTSQREAGGMIWHAEVVEAVEADAFPARTAPMVDIFDAFLAAMYERNPGIDEDAALYAAERQTERYAR